MAKGITVKEKVDRIRKPEKCSVKRAVIKVAIINQDEKKVVKGKVEVGFLKDE